MLEMSERRHNQPVEDNFESWRNTSELINASSLLSLSKGPGRNIDCLDFPSKFGRIQAKAHDENDIRNASKRNKVAKTMRT